VAIPSSERRAELRAKVAEKFADILGKIGAP